DLTTQGVLIEAFHHAILDHYPAVDHYRLHPAAGFRIDELPGRAVVGQVSDVVEIDENQIRLVAGPKGAETSGKASRTRVADGSMPQNLVREAWARFRLADCRDQAEDLHRLEYALHIGTATVVATQPETHACLAHVVNWGNAALEFEVAELIEHDARIGG